MPFDIPTFNQNLNQYGTSSANKYDVNIALPPILQSVSGNASFPYVNLFAQMIPFRALSCSTPGGAFLNVETHKLGVGPRIKQPFNIAFADLRMTMLGDSQQIIEKTMMLWMNAVYNFSFDSTNSATFLTNYRSIIASSQITINKYDYDGSIITTYNIMNCVPMVFVAQPLEWENTNSLNKLTASFHYISYSIN